MHRLGGCRGFCCLDLGEKHEERPRVRVSQGCFKGRQAALLAVQSTGKNWKPRAKGS